MFFLQSNDAVFPTHFLKAKVPRQPERGDVSLINPCDDFTVQLPHSVKIPTKHRTDAPTAPFFRNHEQIKLVTDSHKSTTVEQFDVGICFQKLFEFIRYFPIFVCAQMIFDHLPHITG